MDCTVWNERHRTRLACRRPGAGAHRNIERGKVPNASSAVSPFLYCFTMSWWVGGAGGRQQWTVLSGTSAIGHDMHVADRAQGLTGT